MRLHHDLDAAIFFLTERLVHFRRLIECDAMRDDERRIDLATLDPLQKSRHVLVHMGLTHLERQPFRERRTEREFVEPSTVDAGDRDGATLAARANRLAKRMRPI